MKEEVLPFPATGFSFSLKEKYQWLEIKAENLKFSGFKEKVGLPLRRAVGTHCGCSEGVQHGCRGLVSICTGDQQQHPTGVYFLGYKGSHNTTIMGLCVKNLHFNLCCVRDSSCYKICHCKVWLSA